MRCPTCGEGELEPGIKRVAREVDGRRFTADLPAMVCSRCHEKAIAGVDLERFELTIAAELGRGGARSGEALKYQRGALGLRATELSELLGVSAETLSRWETGEREPPRAALATVGALVLDELAGSTTTADRLRALQRSRPALARVIRLDFRPASRVPPPDVASGPVAPVNDTAAAPPRTRRGRR